MKYLINNNYYNPVRVGDKGDFYEGDETAICGDCGAKLGEQHYEGCDCERCPLCYGQLLTCGHDVYEVAEQSESQAE